MLRRVVCLLSVTAAAQAGQDVLDDAFVQRVRAAGARWQVELPRDPRLRDLRLQRGEIRRGLRRKSTPPPEYRDDPPPKMHFDARKRWSQCKGISDVSDQSACVSDWAVAAADSMSDRLCIASGAAKQLKTLRLSSFQIMSCCGILPQGVCGLGCLGGSASLAWDYWLQQGLVSSRCLPYPFPPCNHSSAAESDISPCPSWNYQTPACPKTCNTNHSEPTRFYANKSYTLSGEEIFMRELYERGPFEVSMTMYEDFLAYSSGIYKHVYGNEIRTHFARLVGWGEEKGEPYWIVANSWNKKWGEDGFFRIARGVNECDIESQGAAGTPDLQRR